jgi:hypothetical protein
LVKTVHLRQIDPVLNNDHADSRFKIFNELRESKGGLIYVGLVTQIGSTIFMRNTTVHFLLASVLLILRCSFFFFFFKKKNNIHVGFGEHQKEP